MNKQNKTEYMGKQKNKKKIVKCEEYFNRYQSQKVEVKLSFLRSMKKLSQRIRGYFWVLLDYVE